MNYRRIAEKLSTDRPFEILNMQPPTIESSYIIYANGTRWYLDCWVTWRLYWIPGDEIIDVPSRHSLVYQCAWLSEKRHINNIESIIWKHPNCTNWKWRWMPASIIKFFWTIGFRFTKDG